MLVLSCRIGVGSVTLGQVEDVTITSSRRSLANECTITLPRRSSKYLETIGLPFEVGQDVAVALGYEGVDLQEEFRGFIDQIIPGPSVTLVCSDIRPLRKQVVNKSFKNTTIRRVITEVLAGTGVTLSPLIPDIRLDSLRVDNTSVEGMLLNLMRETQITAYLRRGQLYVGPAFVEGATQEIECDFARNVQDSRLRFLEPDRRRFQVRVKSVLKNLKTKEVVVGQKGGERRNLILYNNITDEKLLREAGLRELEKINYSGVEGSVTLWGYPFAEHGQVAVIKDPYDEVTGKYIIEATTVGFGGSGYFRELALGPKL